MNLKKSPFSIQDKTSRDLDNASDYLTLADLIREQNWREVFPKLVELCDE